MTTPTGTAAPKLRDARDLDALRPDNTWGAIRLDWASGLAVGFAISLLVTAVLTPLAMTTDLSVLLALSAMPLASRLTSMRGRDAWLSKPATTTGATLRAALPLSRRAVTRARYASALGTALSWWLTSALTASVTGSITGIDPTRAHASATILVTFLVVFAFGTEPVWRDSLYDFTRLDLLLGAALGVMCLALLVVAFVFADSAPAGTAWLIVPLIVGITAVSYTLSVRVHLGEDL